VGEISEKMWGIEESKEEIENGYLNFEIKRVGKEIYKKEF
jgi:hypothetical protein